MHRDLARLASEEFDVIVVGGGVYALTIARELACRDLRVAVLERDDFAGATSFNSLKTIHGGIRALQHGAVGIMREFVRERRAFAILAPHLVRPLPFVVPTYRHPIRNRAAMAAFFALYDWLSADRNRGVDPSRALPPSRTMGRAECLRLSPAIEPAGVTGGALWHDYQLHSPERFAMALLQSAPGATAANYAEVTSFAVRNGAVHGVTVRDRLSGSSFDVRGRVVVNAAGPWAWELLERARPATGPAHAFSLAMNLVVNRLPLPQATGGLVAGRFLFMVPWRDRTMIGTSHDAHAGPASTLRVGGARLETFLEAARTAFPGAGLRTEDITLLHRGLLPAVPGGRADSLVKRSVVHDHREEGVHGLLTVVGVRYTTALATAGQVADRVWQIAGRTSVPPRRAAAPLAGGDIMNLAEYERTEIAGTGLEPALVRRLIAAYGTRYTAVARRIRADAQLARPLSSVCAVIEAEIDHAVRDEMALHLSDALLRRTSAGAGGYPGDEAVARAAAIMGGLHDWTAGRVSEEIAAVKACYAIT